LKERAGVRSFRLRERAHKSSFLEGEGGEGSFYKPPPVAVFDTCSKEISS